MSVRALIPFASLLALAACSHPTSPSGPSGPAASSTYYVSTEGSDVSAGTQQQPFRTIKKGLNLIRPGGTLYIRGGTYNETIMETSFGATGTSWSASLTVAGYPGETVILRPSFGPAVVRFQDHSIEYVLIKDMTLDAINQPVGDCTNTPVVFTQGDNLHFDTVEVTNGSLEGISSGGSHNEFRNMHVHRNGGGPTATDQCQVGEGIYNTGSFNSFVGGEYENNECNAIRIWDSAHPANESHDNLVSGLTIHDNGNGHAQLRTGVSNCHSGGGGLTVGDYNNTVINNIIYNAFWGWDDAWGQAPGETRGNRVENNTIYDVDYCCRLFSNHTTFENNTIYQVANGVSILNQGTGNTVENNHLTGSQP